MIAVLLLAMALASGDDVKPVRHEIELTIDPASDTFSGYARISIELAAPKSVIRLNGRDLKVTDAWIEAQGKRIAATTEADGGEYLDVSTAAPVGPGPVKIGITYTAPLSAEAVSGPNRKKVGDDWYVFTTFTPTDARRAFPCFDEPRYKTPWDISIITPMNRLAFSNAPLVSHSDVAGQQMRWRFASTPPLAAEVVAFAVGPFDVLDADEAGAKHTHVRVITARGQSALGKEAGLATEDVLPRLEKYTGIPYPWDKLDHVALPQGAFGAVENPGLITYQARQLLVPPARPEGIRALEAHEIGHQWFGNLVTQASWTDVWLSEGFATWISAKIMDEEQPADRKHINLVQTREAVMTADGGPASHPVRREVHTRAELDTVYDRTPYQKGGAILLMLENWLGEDVLQASLRKYLAAHAMGNATTADLEAALPARAKPVMDGMLNTVGVPVVSARCADGKLAFKREAAERPGSIPIPVCWKSAAGRACAENVAQTKTGESCGAWFFPNSTGAGYYRFAWTHEQLSALPLDQLTGAERLTLVFDLRAQHLMDPILNKLTNDTQPEVVRAAKLALGIN